jgi:hypothetical protein
MSFISFTIGIKVAQFQMDGFFSIYTFLNHTGGVGPENLTDFTLCLRQNVNFWRGRTSFSFSYSTDLSDNALTVAFYQSEEAMSPIKLGICKYRYWKKECNFKEIGIIVQQEWHHVCFVMTAQDYGSAQVKSTMKLYYDGQFAQQGKCNQKKLRDCCVARLRDCCVAKLRDCCVARLCDCCVARLHDCCVTRLRDCCVARLSDCCKVARLHDCCIARLSYCCVARLRDCCVARLRDCSVACKVA